MLSPENLEKMARLERENKVGNNERQWVFDSPFFKTCDSFSLSLIASRVFLILNIF